GCERRVAAVEVEDGVSGLQELAHVRQEEGDPVRRRREVRPRGAVEAPARDLDEREADGVADGHARRAPPGDAARRRRVAPPGRTPRTSGRRRATRFDGAERYGHGSPSKRRLATSTIVSPTSRRIVTRGWPRPASRPIVSGTPQSGFVESWKRTTPSLTSDE